MVTRGPYDSNSAAQFDPRTLGERIKKLRWHFGWTQSDLSEALNTDQAIISNWERDKARPSGAALAALAQVFRLTPAALDTGDGFTLPELVTEGSETGATTVALPSPGKQPITLLDLKRDQTQELGFQEALAQLLKATQGGRSVWIVVR